MVARRIDDHIHVFVSYRGDAVLASSIAAQILQPVR
jgi:hypothetical protein